MMTLQRSFLVFLMTSALLAPSLRAQDFLTANGNTIVNGQGDPVLLRGMGLGGWMVQEGYMLQTSSFANAQHEISLRSKEIV